MASRLTTLYFRNCQADEQLFVEIGILAKEIDRTFGWVAREAIRFGMIELKRRVDKLKQEKEDAEKLEKA